MVSCVLIDMCVFAYVRMRTFVGIYVLQQRAHLNERGSEIWVALTPL